MPPETRKRRSILGDAAKQARQAAEEPDVPAVLRREDEDGKTWDQRNKAHAFRIREVDAERLTTRAREFGLSKDALGAALVWAGLDALDAGALTLEIEEQTTEVVDKLDRLRVYVKRRARPLWQSEKLPERNEQRGP